MILVVMGVSGSGKTEIGVRLAERLGVAFLEGDSFHPPENVAKMRSGAPLGGADRWPWLERIAAELERRRAAGASVVLACSALRRRYRDFLVARCPGLCFLYLAGDKTLIAERLAGRKGHFMPPALLDSQFADLEPPEPDEPAITVPIDSDPETIVASILARLNAP